MAERGESGGGSDGLSGPRRASGAIARGAGRNARSDAAGGAPGAAVSAAAGCAQHESAVTHWHSVARAGAAGTPSLARGAQ